ncbi:hypothetical protein ACM9HC_32930, partial [Streptomyces sp. JAC18]|uniref:hypothetical protein n=1 Tax=Streptomyces sp. JAC18 TaxID=3418414 RepID=UPI003D819C50
MPDASGASCRNGSSDPCDGAAVVERASGAEWDDGTAAQDGAARMRPASSQDGEAVGTPEAAASAPTPCIVAP